MRFNLIARGIDQRIERFEAPLRQPYLLLQLTHRLGVDGGEAVIISAEGVGAQELVRLADAAGPGVPGTALVSPQRS